MVPPIGEITVVSIHLLDRAGHIISVAHLSNKLRFDTFSLSNFLLKMVLQKQRPRGIPRKRCSENMHQIYGRTPMPKCDFNKVAWVFSCKFAAYFQNTLS